MFFKTRLESEKRIEALGFDVERLLSNGYEIQRRIENLCIDGVFYKEYAAAKELVKCMPSNSGYFLLITEYGIWPSREDWGLFYKLRSAYGEKRELYESPGHVFGAYEKDDLHTYIFLMLCFGWGGYLVQNSASKFCFISHDGWMGWANDVRGRISPNH